MGEPIPEILSVWTTFTLGPNDVSPIFDAFGNDVTGIGLSPLKSGTPPLRSNLFHNHVTQLPYRAGLQTAPPVG